TANKIRMTSRNDDLRATQSIFHSDDVGAEAIADVVIFNHHALALRHYRFKFPKIENHVRAIKSPDSAADDFARAILEFFVNHFLLNLPDALHHRLLGSLRGDAAKISRRHFHLDRVANLSVRFDLARFAKRDLVLRIGDVLDHNEVRERADVAG